MLDTSWEKSSKWYKKIVGTEGQYFHQQIILPNTLRLLRLQRGDSVLDLGCGQGVLERNIPQEIPYMGVDLSPSLISEAKSKKISNSHEFLVGDVSKKLPIVYKTFSKAVIILALQNIKKPFGVIRSAREVLKENGKLLLVINHPIFRIPRMTSWGVDKTNNVQYRRIDQYMSPLEIPIQTHPGLKHKNNDTTWSFHYPLSAISEMLFDNGFVIEKIEEWISDKQSTGGAAKMENKARKEFPMFMALMAKKV